MSLPADIEPDVKLASALSPKIALRGVSFPSVSARIIRPLDKAGLDYSLSKVRVYWGVEGEELRVMLPFGLHAYPIGDPEHRVAEFSIAIRLDYQLRLEGDALVNGIPHFGAICGYMHAWPYFRADIQWLTTKIGLPALVLPVIVSGDVPDRVLLSAEPLNAATSGLPPGAEGTRVAPGRRRKRTTAATAGK